MSRDDEAGDPPDRLMDDRDDYGFAARYAWLNDRLGVSWQLAYAPTV